jgi:N-methylhydantoinase B
MRTPDVEATEVFYPFVMIYRREREDSAGVGRWHGGVGVEYALTPYRAGPVEVITNCGGTAVSTTCGSSLFGGYPVPPARYEVVKGSDVLDLFASGEVPRTSADVAGSERLRLRGKSNGTPIGSSDVLITSVPGGGGYGDPLERAPELVAGDVAVGHVSAATAADVYGVLVRTDMSVDAKATDERRARLRAQRSEWRPAAELLDLHVDDDGVTPASGLPARQVHPAVVARDEGDQRVLACARCDHVLADYRGDYRLGLLADAGPITAIPATADPSFFLDDEVLFWRFCCPSCHTLMSTQISRSGDPFVTEMRLA